MTYFRCAFCYRTRGIAAYAGIHRGKKQCKPCKDLVQKNVEKSGKREAGK